MKYRLSKLLLLQFPSQLHVEPVDFADSQVRVWCNAVSEKVGKQWNENTSFIGLGL